MHITTFIELYNPTFRFNRVDSRPREGEHRGCEKFRHYLVYLTTSRGTITEFYSVLDSVREGPFLVNVLESWVCNAVCGDMTYKEACEEISGVIDYREWQSCRNMRDGLIDIFGREGFGELLRVYF